MALVYFDASALVKLLVEEVDAGLAQRAWDGCDLAASSRVAYPEVCAALAAAERNHAIDRRTAATARTQWDEYWSVIQPVELVAAVAQSAGDLAGRHALSGADAVHLASALALGSTAVVLATWDRHLHSAASLEGLTTLPG